MIKNKFISPLFVTLPRKTKPGKKVSLNLNVYMHIHPKSINDSRKIYFNLMKEQLNGHVFGEIDLCFVLFKGSNRNIDRANFLSIVEKFFCDALVNHGCIKDDSDKFIRSTTYVTGGVDHKNPRVEILITELNRKD